MTAARPPVAVTGVSGAGKSTVGRLLAARLAVPFADGDDLHPAANVAKMASGRPLEDADRAPWLLAVGAWLAAHPRGGVAACSALRRRYRDVLRSSAPGLVLLHLHGDPALVAERAAARTGHFMPTALLASQLAALEALEEDEAGLVVDVSASPGDIVETFVEWLDAPRRGARPLE